MLEKSRAADSGLKLEVNGKILDSCTELMKCIRKLVKKSRLLQAEIVEQGKVKIFNIMFYINVAIYMCLQRNRKKKFILNFRALPLQRNFINVTINGLKDLYQQQKQLQWVLISCCK